MKADSSNLAERENSQRTLSLQDLAAILSAYAVALAAIQVFAIGLSLLRVSLTQSLALATLYIAVGAGFTQGYWLWKKNLIDRGTLPSSSEETCTARWVSWVILGLGTLLFVFLLFEGCVKPDFSWDGPAYHIPVINFWAQKGYIHIIEHDPALGVEGIPEWIRAIENILNAFPFSVETCAWVIVTAFDNTRLVNIPNLVYAPLGVLGIAYLARVLGTGPRLSLAAGFCFIFLPVTIQQSASTMIDAGFASAVIAMLALAVHLMLGFARQETHWSFAVPAGCAMGLTLGAKVSGCVLAVCCGGVLALFLVVSGCRFRSDTSLRIPFPSFSGKHLARGTLCLALVAACALAVGGFWNLRNYVHYGNPMWPARISVAGHDIFAHAQERQNADLDRQYPASKLWLQGGIGNKSTEWPKSIRDHSNWHGGIGYLWLFGCLPAIGLAFAFSLWSFFKRFRDKSFSSWFGIHLWPLLLICIAGFIILPGAGRARYSYWIYALGLPCFFWLAMSSFRMRTRFTRPWTYLLRVWVFFCMGLALFEGFYCAAWWGTKSYAWATGEKWPPFREAPARVLKSLYWYDPVGYHIPPLTCTVFDEILRGTDAVALHRMQDPPLARLLIGQLSKPIGARPVYFIGNEVLNDEAALTEQVKKHEIRYIIVEYTYKVPKAALKLCTRHHEIPYYFWVLEFPPETE